MKKYLAFFIIIVPCLLFAPFFAYSENETKTYYQCKDVNGNDIIMDSNISGADCKEIGNFEEDREEAAKYSKERDKKRTEEYEKEQEAKKKAAIEAKRIAEEKAKEDRIKQLEKEVKEAKEAANRAYGIAEDAAIRARQNRRP